MKPFFFFIFLFISLTFLSLEASSSLYKDTQQLINFKSSLPNQSHLQNWLPNQNPCFFTGVACSKNRVSSIDLSLITLSIDFHSVWSFLLSLENIESLSLSATNISGSLVMPAGSNNNNNKCSSVLTSLDLSLNSLTGPLSDLSNLGICLNLKILNLSSNGFDFSVKESVGLKQLSNLEVIDLSLNKIYGANVVPWIVNNYGNGNITHLALSGNKITGDINVSNCINLRFLDVSFNNISSSIPTFGDCLALEYLDISGNRLFGDIGKAIASCNKLNLLNASSNQFAGQIPDMPSTNLQYLSLAGNDFQGSIPMHLVDTCSRLIVLDLSSNKLNGMIPSGFGLFDSMEYLNVSMNNFSGRLPFDTFSSMSKLKKLDLSFNSFFGKLPDSLSKFTSLETLDLSSNNLSGVIPAGLCQDPGNTLKELYLPNNLFDGEIPATLSNCTQLVSLDLSFNYLKGTIPASIGLLSKLRDLKLWLNQLHGEIPEQLMYAQELETLFLDFNELTGPIPDGLSNCSNLIWISLSNNKLSGEIPGWMGRLESLAILKLSNNSFYGRIPPELGDSRSLIWLDLNTNRLNGTIPPELFKQSGNITPHSITGKRYAYLKNDGSKQCHGAGNLLEFAGIRPEQLSRISTRSPCNFTRVYNGHTQPTFNYNGSMIFLDISYNLLSGSIPSEIGVMSYLYVLNIGHNNLSGVIPDELGNLRELNILDLSTNSLDGRIPQSMTKLTLLTEIDLSNNQLTGMIPEAGQFETFPANRFANNPGLCGYPLPSCSDKSSIANSQHKRSHRRQASLAGSVAMGLLFSLFCIFGLIIVIVETKKRRKKKDSTLDVYMDTSHSGTAHTSWRLTGQREALSINLATFEKPLRKLTFADLLEATNGFHDDSLIGSGGFGDVLDDVLHDPKKVGIKLNWSARRKIAIGAARGLAFLHHNCIPHIIHRDMKSSNVLVDENLEARVSDFGMARLMSAMDTHLSVSTLAGTPGYVPPEYYQSFRCSTKGDVYSFGVVLLELLTGKRPTDSPDFGDNNLVGWVKQHAKLKISDVFDPELMKEDPALEIELLQHLKIACACLDDRPFRRPTMIQVMAMFKEIQAGSGMDSQSTIATEDGGFSSVEMVDMTIKEGNET
ncbi:hypothetical protein ACFE04_018077 [Oxalis oulophora]